MEVMSLSQQALGRCASNTRPTRLGEALVILESVVEAEPATACGAFALGG